MALEPDNPAQRVLAAAKAQAAKTYRITWIGSKIPRGATFNGVAIDWTQNDQVHAGGRVVATYTRVRVGGYHVEGDPHIMDIHTAEGATIITPDGTPAEERT